MYQNFAILVLINGLEKVFLIIIMATFFVFNTLVKRSRRDFFLQNKNSSYLKKFCAFFDTFSVTLGFLGFLYKDNSLIPPPPDYKTGFDAPVKIVFCTFYTKNLSYKKSKLSFDIYSKFLIFWRRPYENWTTPQGARAKNVEKKRNCENMAIFLAIRAKWLKQIFFF